MEDYTVVILLVAAAVLLVGLVVYFIQRRKKQKSTRIGKNGEKKVLKVLKKFGRFYNVKILGDVYLPLYDETTQIDHILIAPFGVMVIETKNWAGDIYGDPSEDKWLQVVGDDRNHHYNPLKQNKTHLDNLRHVFKKENIYRVNVEGVVVFTNGRSNLYCPRGVPVMKLKQFKKLLKQPAYEADNKVDVEKVYNAIVKNQVTDKKKIAQHEKNVQKKAKARS